jgi:hypothetical protein
MDRAIDRAKGGFDVPLNSFTIIQPIQQKPRPEHPEKKKTTNTVVPICSTPNSNNLKTAGKNFQMRRAPCGMAELNVKIQSGQLTLKIRRWAIRLRRRIFR